jgi:hypothetical protein
MFSYYIRYVHEGVFDPDCGAGRDISFDETIGSE